LGSNLGDQHEFRRIGMEGGTDQLVGNVRAIELGRVYVVDT
jgi:hypothetical protein